MNKWHVSAIAVATVSLTLATFLVRAGRKRSAAYKIWSQVCD